MSEQNQIPVTSVRSASATELPVIQNISTAPITNRIDVLDILRGFALSGILLMNIEWFNRPIAELADFDPSLTGSDYAVSWLVKCFIEGKFYKLFALLFGMGIAVMIVRAQQTDRPFFAILSRRMAALFVFGMAHLIFLWQGDILHDYAFAGFVLLGWIALLRIKKLQRFANPQSLLRMGLTILAFPFIATIYVGVWYGATLDKNDLAEHWQKSKNTLVLVETFKAEAVQTAKQLAEKNYVELINLNLDVHTITLAQEQLQTEISTIPLVNQLQNWNNFTSPMMPVMNAAFGVNLNDQSANTIQAELADIAIKKKKLEDEQAARDKFKGFQKSEKKTTDEIAAITDINYFTSVQFRFKSTGEYLMKMVVFGFIALLPIFLIGFWLIASGVISNADKNKNGFKLLAWGGLVFGLILTIASLFVIQYPASKDLGFIQGPAGTLFYIGQFLMTGGYLGLIVSACLAEKWRRRLSFFIPLGKMAFTNYILHTVILSAIFYGYGGAMFGEISRTPQMLIAIAILVSQVYLCKLWLRHFHFGPVEWLWRSITYWKVQPLRL